MQLDGNVVLCGRSDDPSGRHFDGRLAYLGLYDQALDEAQVGCVVGNSLGGVRTYASCGPAWAVRDAPARWRSACGRGCCPPVPPCA